MIQETTVTLTVNGRKVTAGSPAHFTLLRWLRDFAGCHDVKYGCGEGVCGTCTVLLDGATASSCLVLAAQVSGAEIRTLAGMSDRSDGLGDIQRAFLVSGASQCGFCTGGMILTAAELLEENSRPTRDEIRRALIGNLCRCTGYQSIVDAVETVAKERSAT
jgi:carbon-monoxide dehydrogenase small subunit